VGRGKVKKIDYLVKEEHFIEDLMDTKIRIFTSRK